MAKTHYQKRKEPKKQYPFEIPTQHNLRIGDRVMSQSADTFYYHTSYILAIEERKIKVGQIFHDPFYLQYGGIVVFQRRDGAIKVLVGRKVQDELLSKL